MDKLFNIKKVFFNTLLFFFLTVSCLFATPGYPLRESTLPQKYQTHIQKPIYRYISLTLPLVGVEDWIFTDKQALLSGKLILIIQRNGTRQEIVVFKHGKLSRGWHFMPLGAQSHANEVNFKFVSTQKYLTAPHDTVELLFLVKQDLYGIGPYFSGILTAGVYTSVGRYSGLTDIANFKNTIVAKVAGQLHATIYQQGELLRSLNHKAFLSHWDRQWTIKKVNDHGWMSATTIPWNART